MHDVHVYVYTSIRRCILTLGVRPLPMDMHAMLPKKEWNFKDTRRHVCTARYARKYEYESPQKKKRTRIYPLVLLYLIFFFWKNREKKLRIVHIPGGMSINRARGKIGQRKAPRYVRFEAARSRVLDRHRDQQKPTIAS